MRRSQFRKLPAPALPTILWFMAKSGFPDAPRAECGWNVTVPETNGKFNEQMFWGADPALVRSKGSKGSRFPRAFNIRREERLSCQFASSQSLFRIWRSELQLFYISLKELILAHGENVSEWRLSIITKPLLSLFQDQIFSGAAVWHHFCSNQQKPNMYRWFGFKLFYARDG